MSLVSQEERDEGGKKIDVLCFTTGDIKMIHSGLYKISQVQNYVLVEKPSL